MLKATCSPPSIDEYRIHRQHC